MITEDALPTYMTMLNTLDGVRDETGASQTPWATWTRAWTAEENRHGDIMNKYMYLTGRVNMKAVEVTIQNLISRGMDPKTENNPYLGFTYTSFQERATKVRVCVCVCSHAFALCSILSIAPLPLTLHFLPDSNHACFLALHRSPTATPHDTRWSTVMTSWPRSVAE